MTSLAKIDREAQRLLARHGQSGPPVDVEVIALAEGLRVVRRALQGNTSGLLIRNKSEPPLLGVNEAHHPRRQRFTIAHEIGHFKMHEGRVLLVDSAVRVNKRDDLSSMATNSEEIEANAFAACLLMPADEVFRLVASTPEPQRGDPDRLAAALARRFEVSDQAMGFRLHNLGITS